MSSEHVFDKVCFLMNGDEVLNYDRSQPLPEQYRQSFDEMDIKMDDGFELSNQKIESPDFQSKTQFVAINLVQALLKNDDQMAIMLFSYLVNRMPDLKQAKAKTKKGEMGYKIGVEFVFDEVKPDGQKIQFHPNIKMH